jgi:hypothetical protein
MYISITLVQAAYLNHIQMILECDSVAFIRYQKSVSQIGGANVRSILFVKEHRKLRMASLVWRAPQCQLIRQAKVKVVTV